MNNHLLTRPEAAEYMRISPKTLANWYSADQNKIPVVKIGRLCRYRQADLDAFILQNIRNRGAHEP